MAVVILLLLQSSTLDRSCFS